MYMGMLSWGRTYEDENVGMHSCSQPTAEDKLQLSLLLVMFIVDTDVNTNGGQCEYSRV